VFCQLATLKSCLSITAVKNALKTLPKSLDETYDRILLGIDEQNHNFTIAALQWLVLSERPLQVKELAEAVIIQPYSGTVNAEDRLLDPRDVLRVLSSLVVTWKEARPGESDQDSGQPSKYWARFDEDDSDDSDAEFSEDESRHEDEAGDKTPQVFEMVMLAHLSVKEYLVSCRILRGPASAFGVEREKSHRHLTESCLRYIRHFDDVISQSSFNDYVEESPLIYYASNYWPNHAKTCQNRKIVLLVSEFLRSPTLVCRWLSVVPKKRFWTFDQHAAPHYIASRLGLNYICEEVQKWRPHPFVGTARSSLEADSDRRVVRTTGSAAHLPVSTENSAQLVVRGIQQFQDQNPSFTSNIHNRYQASALVEGWRAVTDLAGTGRQDDMKLVRGEILRRTNQYAVNIEKSKSSRWTTPQGISYLHSGGRNDDLVIPSIEADDDTSVMQSIEPNNNRMRIFEIIELDD
jgi:hypothetical protein